MQIALPWIASVVAGLWIGSYFSPYLKKRSENLATHDDIGKLVDQVKATAEATKAIESRIDDQMWNKQRQWEIKRDALFEGCRAMAEFNTALLHLHTVWTFDPKEVDEETAKREMIKHQSAAAIALNDASNSFQRAQLLISIVSGNELQRALANMDTILKNLSSQIVHGDKTIYAALAPLIKGAEKIVIEAMKNELGILKAVPMPQSSES